MKVLITGGAGFIGSHLADALVGVGDAVTLLDSLHPQIHPAGAPTWLSPAARLVVGDVGDLAVLASAMQACEVVYHLAAETGTGQSMYEPHRYVACNVLGTAAVLEVAQAMNPRPRIVLASSRAIYGEGAGRCASCGLVYPAVRGLAALAAARWEPSCPHCGGELRSEPTGESAPTAPASIYGVTKLAQEELFRVAGAAGAIDCWALRFQNVFGPRQSLANPYTGLLAVFATRLRAGQPCELYEDGDCTRDFVEVADVVTALRAAGTAKLAGFQAVNIGSGRATTVREIAGTVAEILGADQAPVLSGKYRAGDIRHASADISRARQLLDWQARTPLRDGLARFLAWAQQQPAGTDQSNRAHEELRQRGFGG